MFYNSTMYELSFNLRAFSSNSAHYLNKQLTNEAREYREQFLIQLNKDKNRKAVESVQARFNPKKHSFKIEYLFLIQEEYFYTKKKGDISNRSMDLDNCIKLPQDFIFNKKYIDRVMEGTKLINLGLDDKFVTDLNIKKRPGTQFSILIKISILNNRSFDLEETI